MTWADALASIALCFIALITANFDKIVEKGWLYSNFKIMGSETFAGYLASWAPACTLTIIAVIALISAILLIGFSKFWSGWVLNLLAMIPVVVACARHTTAIIFNPSMDLLLIFDKYPIIFGSCCIGIALIGLSLKIFKKDQLL